MEIITDFIIQDDDGIRLDRWFKRRYPAVPFVFVAKFARTGQIRVDGKRVLVSTKVKAKQKIRFPIIAENLKPQVKSEISAKYVDSFKDENLTTKFKQEAPE